MARRSKELEADSLSLAAAVEAGSATNRPIESQSGMVLHWLKAARTYRAAQRVDEESEESAAHHWRLRNADFGLRI
jgi:hypothetical protein